MIRFQRLSLVAAILIALPLAVDAQDRLKTMPGYEQFERMSKEIPGAVKMGTVAVTWKDNGQSFEYRHDAKKYRFDFATGKPVLVEEPKKDDEKAAPKAVAETDKAKAKGRGQQGGQAKGEQGGQAKGQGRNRTADPAQVPGGSSVAGRPAPPPRPTANRRQSSATAICGSPTPRAKTRRPSPLTAARRAGSSTAPRAGSTARNCSRRTAMWWSPDSKKLAYYRFDESQGRRLLPALDQAKLQSKLDVEPYPKAGAPNPVVDLFVYDVATKKIGQDRRPRRQAVRQRRRRPLRLPRRLVARRQGTALQPDEPPAERHGVRRRRSGDRQVPRHRPRGMAGELGRERTADALPEGQQAASSGPPSATAGGTSTSTTSRASCWRRSPTTSSKWPTSCGSTRTRACCTTWPAAATTR